MEHEDLIVGHAHFSDAGVFRVRPDLALVQTVDFFPPIVDDPRDFGRIAAANALSDCYAMGGKPLTALNIAGFPSKKLPTSYLGAILAGGAEKVIEAGAVIVGGHTVEDSEVKYGLCVTGTVHPESVITNAGARPGQALVLTKPLGMGTVSTGIKQQQVSDALIAQAVTWMATLNRDACERMVELGAAAATDITGFGLLGHAYELAEGSGVTLRLDVSRIPILAGVEELARAGLLSGGVRKNRAYVEEHVRGRRGMDPVVEDLLFDSETSGGLLIALGRSEAETLVRSLHEAGHAYATIVGDVLPRGPFAIELGE